MNTILADGPRQVVNAITLYSVMQMNLLPGGENAVEEDKPGILQFFDNVKILAEENSLRALIMAGMVFTLVIWVLSIIKLLIAIVLYLLFLFHHIPAQDGTLKAYCRRKINTRLKRIVRTKVDKALAKGVALQDRDPTNPNFETQRKPTLPVFGEDDKTPIVSTLPRTETQGTLTTLPAYTSRPGTAAPTEREPTLPDVGTFSEKPALSRTVTESSAYSEAVPLSAPAVSEYSPLDRQGSPAPPVPDLPDSASIMTGGNQTPVPRPNFTPTPSNLRGPPSRMGSAGGTRTPGPDPFSPEEYRSPQSDSPFRPYGSPADLSSRTITPRTPATPGNGPLRTYTPSTPYNTRTPPQSVRPPRSLNPGAQPMSHGSPAYSNGENPHRPFSPAVSRGPPRAPGGYVPYNAPTVNNTFTTSPTTEYGTVSEYGSSGGQAYTSPAYTPQPPHRPDYY